MSFRSENFVTIRRDIRRHLTTSPSGQRLDSLVGALLGVAEDDPELPTVDLAFPHPPPQHGSSEPPIPSRRPQLPSRSTWTANSTATERCICGGGTSQHTDH